LSLNQACEPWAERQEREERILIRPSLEVTFVVDVTSDVIHFRAKSSFLEYISELMARKDGDNDSHEVKLDYITFTKTRTGMDG